MAPSMHPTRGMRHADPIVRGSLEIDGRRVSYLTVERERPSPTLLLIHGAGVSARTWVNQLRGVSDALWPIAIDLPGHRESDSMPDATLERFADTAGRVLEELRAGPAFVAGHSLGGAVAQLLAARSPEMVTGLILISTCVKMPPEEGAARLLGFVPAPLRRGVLLWSAREVLFAPSASAAAIRLTLDEIGGCRPQTLHHDAALGRAMNLTTIASHLRVPTLVLCGARDRLTAPALAQELSAMIGGARLEIVPSAGHMLPLEAPGAVNRAILEFADAVAHDGARRGAPPRASTKTGWRGLFERFSWR
jgi:pimeloyl-ACP methyl ester carboxylesterase